MNSASSISGLDPQNFLGLQSMVGGLFDSSRLADNKGWSESSSSTTYTYPTWHKYRNKFIVFCHHHVLFFCLTKRNLQRIGMTIFARIQTLDSCSSPFSPRTWNSSTRSRFFWYCPKKSLKEMNDLCWLTTKLKKAEQTQLTQIIHWMIEWASWCRIRRKKRKLYWRLWMVWDSYRGG